MDNRQDLTAEMINFLTQLLILLFMLSTVAFMFRLAVGKKAIKEGKRLEAAIEKHGPELEKKLGVPKPKLEKRLEKTIAELEKKLGVPKELEKGELPVATEEEVKRKQKEDIWAEAYELGKAVSRGVKIAGKLCDCGYKHALALRYEVDEIPMPELEESLSKLREGAQMVIDYSKGYEPYTLIPSREEGEKITRLLREGRKGLWAREKEKIAEGEWGKGAVHRKIAEERKS